MKLPPPPPATRLARNCSPLLAIVLLTSVIAGCSTPQYQWAREHSTIQQFYRESAECKASAGPLPAALAQQAEVMYGICMERRGWRRATY